MSSATATLWKAPELTDRSTRGSTAPGPNVAELAAIEQAARDEGLALGRAEGLAQGQAEVQRLIGQLEALLNGFTRPLQDLDEEVEATLAALAVRVAGALLGRAYQAEPALLAALVRTALEQAGASAREAEVHLHPTDAALLGNELRLPPTARLIGDPSLARGELRVHTELMRLDGTFAARLDTALADLQLAPATVEADGSVAAPDTASAPPIAAAAEPAVVQPAANKPAASQPAAAKPAASQPAATAPASTAPAANAPAATAPAAVKPAASQAAATAPAATTPAAVKPAASATAATTPAATAPAASKPASKPPTARPADEDPA
jgi:flagellar assembly protein FliH